MTDIIYYSIFTYFLNKWKDSLGPNVPRRIYISAFLCAFVTQFPNPSAKIRRWHPEILICHWIDMAVFLCASKWDEINRTMIHFPVFSRQHIKWARFFRYSQSWEEKPYFYVFLISYSINGFLFHDTRTDIHCMNSITHPRVPLTSHPSASPFLRFLWNKARSLWCPPNHRSKWIMGGDLRANPRFTLQRESKNEKKERCVSMLHCFKEKHRAIGNCPYV